MKQRYISVDIGSTFTKGALFELNAAGLCVVEQRRVATTPRDLAEGVGRLLERWHAADRPPLHACSSAKGGLSIVAVGIVPNLTLHAARLAACSAGGRIVGGYAYKLSDQDVRAIEGAAPDIVLLTGGTDGGNEVYNRHNAARLAACAWRGAVLYAGNAGQRDEIRRLLAGRVVVIADNLMPEVGRLEIESTRCAIREIFLQRIVEGKGLDGVAAICAAPIKPTPLAVHDLLETVGRLYPREDRLILADIGGATTDIYSLCDPADADGAVHLRGLPEPRLKRTVEGDLGLRLNARMVFASDPDWFAGQLRASGDAPQLFQNHLDRLADFPGHVPDQPLELWFDRLLAEQCLRLALQRHAGRIEQVYTPQGMVTVQQGKDLRRMRRMIGTGGFLAAPRHYEHLRALCRVPGVFGRPPLLVPQSPEFAVDRNYVFALLGNLAPVVPQAAAALALAELKAA